METNDIGWANSEQTYNPLFQLHSHAQFRFTISLESRTKVDPNFASPRRLEGSYANSIHLPSNIQWLGYWAIITV